MYISIYAVYAVYVVELICLFICKYQQMSAQRRDI